MVIIARRALWGLAIGLLLSGFSGAQAPAIPTQKQWRLLFIGPREAVTLQVTVTTEDGPEAKRGKLAAMLLQRFDADKDQALSPAEAARLPLGAKASGPAVGDQWKALDTAPVDDRLTVDEIVAFVARELGEPFRLTILPSRSFQSVRLVERLDRDNDASLSMEELSGSITRLRQADLDDDEAVSIAELIPVPRRNGQPMDQTASLEAPIILIDTAAGVTNAVPRVLQTHGRDANGLSVPFDRLRSGEASPERFDINQDQRLDAQELTAWLRQSPAAVSIEAFLGQRKKSTVSLQDGTEKQAGTLVSADLGGATVEMNAINISFQQSDSAKLYRTRFLTSDRDKNGYLDATEYTTLLLSSPFQDVDANADAMLMRDELTTFVEFDAVAVQTRIELTVSDASKTLFDLLDGNVDRRLTPREIGQGFERLRSIDRNNDQRVAEAELESRYRLTLSLGRNDLFAGRTSMAMAPTTGRIRTRRDGTAWHQRMDRNQDGDISWREFLGSREQFASLDLDHDGLVDLSEAESKPTGIKPPSPDGTP